MKKSKEITLQTFAFYPTKSQPNTLRSIKPAQKQTQQFPQFQANQFTKIPNTHLHINPTFDIDSQIALEMAQESILNLKNALNNKFTNQKLFDEYIPLTADANVLLTRVQVLDLISDLLNFKKLAETEISRQKQLQIIHQHMENTMTRSQVASPTKQWVQIQHQPIQGIKIQSETQIKQNMREENALKRKQTIEEKIQFFEESLKALKNELIQSQIQENNEAVQDYHPEVIKDFKTTQYAYNQLEKSQNNDASKSNIQKPVQQKEQLKVQDYQAQNHVEDFKKTENNQPKIKAEVKQLIKIQKIPNEIKQKPKEDDEFDFNIKEEVKQTPHVNDFQMDNDFHAPAPKELKEIKKEPKALPKVKEAIQKVDEFDMDMDIDFNAESKPAKAEVAEPEEDKKQKKTKKKVKSAKDAVASVDDFNELNDSASKEPVRDVPTSLTTQLNQPEMDDFNDFMDEKKPVQIKDEFDDMEIDLDAKPVQKLKEDDEFDFNVKEEVKQTPHVNDFQMDNDFHAAAPKELKEIKKEPKALPKVKEAIQKVDEFDMDMDIDFNAESKPAKAEVAEPEEDKKQKKTKKKVKSAKDAVASVDDFNELNDSASKEPVRDVPTSLTTQLNQPEMDDFNDFMDEKKPVQIKDEFDDMEIDLDAKPVQKLKEDDEFDFNVKEEVKQTPHVNDFQMDNDFHAAAPKELKEIKKEPKALPKVKEAIQKVDEFDMDMDIDFNAESKPAKAEVAEPEEDKKQKKTKKKVKSAKDAVASVDDFNELNDSASKEPVRDVPTSLTTQLNQPEMDDFNDFMDEKKPVQIKDEFDDMEIDLDAKPVQKLKEDDEFDFNVKEEVKQTPHVNDFQMDNDFHAPAPKELKEIKKEPKALPKVKEAIQKVDEFDMDMDIDFNAESKPAKVQVAEPEEDKKQKKTKKKVKSAKDAVASVDDFNELNDSASKEPVRDVPTSLTTQLNQPEMDDFNDFMDEKKPVQIKDEFDDMEIDLDAKPVQKLKEDDEFDFNVKEEVKQTPHANDFQMDNDFHAPAPKELKEIKKEPKALPKVKEAIQKVDEFDMDMDIDFNAESKPAKVQVAEPEEDKKQKKTKKKVKSAKDAVASVDDFNELNDSASKEPVRDVPTSLTTQLNQPEMDDFNDFMDEKNPVQIKDEFDDMEIDLDAKPVQKLKEDDFVNEKRPIDEFDMDIDFNPKPKQQNEEDLFESDKKQVQLKDEFDEIDFDFNEPKPKNESENKKEEKKKPTFTMDPFEEEFDVSFNDGVNIQSNNFDAFDMDLDL
ncbi:Hypothetical_protein [Hexamita inflata]|uniref:Hypothetical_protein n=1 Tax=Hexamita inflata TaxID=28002 RepID=A0AA86QWW3_9EUKA|nr:Hypothetical protein HINF_LOCUS55221 [Hexamita inflata]